MVSVLPNLMNSLRNIWVLSKHYNTDHKICGLLSKITFIIVSRVRSFVKFELLTDPETALNTAQDARKLLVEWRNNFEGTRAAIEASQREARWEFSVTALFAPLDHCTTVCSDVIKIADNLSQLLCCFTDEICAITSNPDSMKKAKTKITEITSSFTKMTFDAFDPKNQHIWKTQVQWFERQVRFLDSESVVIAEEAFDYLVSSRLAINALRNHDSNGLQEENWRSVPGQDWIHHHQIY